MARRSGKEKQTTQSGGSLNFQTTIFFLSWFGIVTFFLLGHIYLRFTIRDLRVESARLQSQAEKMRIMEKKLIWEIEKMKQGDRLHEYACRDLGLVDIEPGRIERLRVPGQLITRYASGGKRTGYEVSEWASERYPSGLRSEVGSLLEINRELSAREQTLDEAWKKATDRGDQDNE